MRSYKLFNIRGIILSCTFIFIWGLVGYNNVVSADMANNNSSNSTTVILKPRNNKRLSQMNYQLVTSRNSNYHNYLSSSQFANQYGRSNSDINKLTKYFNQYHLKSNVYSNHLMITVSGKHSNLNRAIEGDKKNQNKLPRNISSNILGVIGNNNKFKFNDSNFYTKHDVNNLNISNNGLQKFINQYNMKDLYKNNNLGQDQNIGIISFANINQSDAENYWKQENIPYKLNRMHVYQTTNDNLWDGSDETTMDAEQAGAVAPQSDLSIYVSDPSIQGMVNSLADAISQNRVSSLSISWGQSEQQVQSGIKAGVIPKSYNDIMNLLFEEANVQGITTFASTGDNGAYDGMGENEYPDLTVDTPANSPYVTAVGGTSLPRLYTINGKKVSMSNERAWSNSLLYSEFNKNHSLLNSHSDWINHYFAAGGGGFSKLNNLPQYQQNIKGIGTYHAQQLWKVSNGYIMEMKKPVSFNGKQKGRNLPDISSNADPNTGYNMYYKGQWFLSGGTSIVAPQMAGVSAIMNANHSQRLGFWNPQIYKFANSSDSPFTSLNSTINNNNLYYTGQPDTIYNQATGLGTVNFLKLNNDFR